jgi:hypothetical protein
VPKDAGLSAIAPSELLEDGMHHSEGNVVSSAAQLGVDLFRTEAAVLVYDMQNGLAFRLVEGLSGAGLAGSSDGSVDTPSGLVVGNHLDLPATVAYSDARNGRISRSMTGVGRLLTGSMAEICRADGTATIGV